MIDGKAFLKQSKELLEVADKRSDYDEKEVYLRSSVSRAYYGLFHEAIVHLQSKCSRQYNEVSKWHTGTRQRDFEGEKTSEHRLVIDILYSMKEARALSSQFKSFRNLRNDADYHFNVPFQFADTKSSLERIDALVVEIKKLRG